MKNGIKHKFIELAQCGIQFKADNDGPLKFSGHASVFNNVDVVGDSVMPGAFADTLKNREAPVRLRWNHFGPVIGKWLELKEDETGLFVEGELTPGHSTAEDVGASLKHGAVDGLSIGYRILDSEMRDEVLLLKELELVEISVVEEPANREALVSQVKSVIESATSLKELEALLRDAGGFSKANAAALISRVKGCLGDPGHADSKPEALSVPDFADLVDQSFNGLYDSLTQRS
ncbi:MAG: HK97 family phage prohead protease [Nitrospinaceae bacterium]|nr:HK97 family phage prohead protease [Nitrospinaceae bacterium]NIR55598.1 HK97 family phage prohead protease [Nitrospinaceae bacterium]NIS86032.1 HK97 family phage prohead protease [Nitrospinaceae bacterium]NIT82875.1 HK97 family phage prohead protease [Nitrospinaceae bacterium]NIU45080.1 HK97 family phage prohead protease [Nitrospinaceae bacterium]